MKLLAFASCVFTVAQAFIAPVGHALVSPALQSNALAFHPTSADRRDGAGVTMFGGSKSAKPAKAAKKAVKKAAVKKAAVKKAVKKPVKNAAAVSNPSFFEALFGGGGSKPPTKATKKPTKAVKKAVAKKSTKAVVKKTAGPSAAASKQRAAKQDAENRKIVEKRRVANQARLFKEARIREGKEKARIALLSKQRKDKEIADKMALRKVAAAAKVEALAREKAKASGKIYSAKVPKLSSQPKIR